MAFAITQTCCTDASCVSVCPVNCIHPTPDEPDFATTDMLYIDPHTCIDCGACADACPVEAIFPIDTLTEPLREYADINAAYYTDHPSTPDTVDPTPNFHQWDSPVFDRTLPSDFEPLDVAVVGTGPAGMYTVEDLLLHTNSRITLIDRLPHAGGLVRYGVAPDHLSTKKVGQTFARFHNHPRLQLRLGLDIGQDLTPTDLNARHDAVIYAVGAPTARSLDLPGADLPGHIAATTVVAWYNNHPEVPADAVDLSGERVVIVGNGNVALDVARILTADPKALEGTSIAPHALARLRSSNVREVVLLGRRGPEHAAYTAPELRALTTPDSPQLVVDTHDPRITDTIDTAESADQASLLRQATREHVDWSKPPPETGRRIVLRFHSAPQEFLGDTTVRSVRVTGDDGDTDIPAGQVVRAIGYRGIPIPGLPFDTDTGTIPHHHGRVPDHPGTYVVGWIKRGPSGGIGANRTCARETVGALLEDALAGTLSTSGRRTRTLKAAQQRLRRLLPRR